MSMFGTSRSAHRPTRRSSSRKPRCLLRYNSFLPICKDGRATQAIKTLVRDVRSLVEHASFLNSKAQFLLDAVLGVLNVEQTNIIKTFTVASVALMPPTLIASIYGMNFEFMPELKLAFGYPLALVLMIVSAIMPILYFRRKGWL